MKLKTDRLIGIPVAICGYPHGCEYTAISHTVRSMSRCSPLWTSHVRLTNTEMDRLWDVTTSVHCYIHSSNHELYELSDNSQFVFTHWHVVLQYTAKSKRTRTNWHFSCHWQGKWQRIVSVQLCFDVGDFLEVFKLFVSYYW
jgi:hypothetical protein